MAFNTDVSGTSSPNVPAANHPRSKADSAGVIPGNAGPATKRNSTVGHQVCPIALYWPEYMNRPLWIVPAQ